MRALECNQYYARAKRSKASKEEKKEDKIGQNIRGEIELYNSFIQETTQNYNRKLLPFPLPYFHTVPQYKAVAVDTW